MARALSVVLGVAVVGLLALIAWQGAPRKDAGPALTTPYHAVLLANGSVFFGKLESAGTPFPVLRDVYYIRSQVNPETKQVANTLIKRGQEWHQPDAMILNAQHVVVIEPVSPQSQVAKLIEEASKK